MKRVIAFLGPPAVGKGTQIGYLDRKKFQIFRLGPILRDRLAAGDESCRVLSKGGLVSADVAMPIVTAEIDNWLYAGAGTDIILDGFPRTVDTADGLDELLEKKGLSLTVIWLTANDATVDVRRKNRAAAARVAGREPHPDDVNDELFKNRLNGYKQDTLPLMNRYKARGQLYEISGEQSIESIQSAIEAVIGDRVGSAVVVKACVGSKS